MLLEAGVCFLFSSLEFKKKLSSIIAALKKKKKRIFNVFFWGFFSPLLRHMNKWAGAAEFDIN